MLSDSKVAATILASYLSRAMRFYADVLGM